jgi:hypothetical protein
MLTTLTHICVMCGAPYQHRARLTCSPECARKREAKRHQRRKNAAVFKSPRHYLRSLCKGKPITVDEALAIYETQQGRCALTGETMTWGGGHGSGHVCPTNISLDRIVAGGPYVAPNVQLVCSAVNSFRKSLPVGDFVEWCRKVVAHRAP